MKILVTGGAGFLGSHLCERLLQMNHVVVCVDNFETGFMSNLSNLLPNPNFELIRHDIIFPLDIKVDGIFNLACPASPTSYQKDPIQTMKTSVYGAVNMLELARKNSATILQASTSEVYGDPEISPQPEEYWGRVNPIGIRSCYDEGKRAAESLFVDHFRKFQTNIRIARIFNTYGPGMSKDDGRVISNFIVSALKNADISVYGNGQQTRSFCYVDDTVSALVSLFLADSYYGPINIGNPEPISMINLAEQIIHLTKSKSRIVFQELPSDDPKERNPEIKKAYQKLGWFPVYSRADGLVKTIEYFKGLLT